MKYQKGMKRYRKAEGKFTADAKGDWFKAKDGKMYAMEVEEETKEEGEEESEKSDLTESDLQKTLDAIEKVYKSEDPQSRKEELLEKAQTSEGLTDEEREELYKALGGGNVADDNTPELGETLVKGFQDNEPIQKALDVSEYLDEQHTELLKSLKTLGESFDTEGRRQHEFNLVLAKAMHQVGTLVKGMSERLGVIENQPVRGPKSRGIGIPAQQASLEKSFGGVEGGERISKSEILHTLEGMMIKSGGRAPCGEDLLHATAKYEQTNQISKALLADVQSHRREGAH